MDTREDFCIFILSNGRPDRVYTYKCFERAGNTAGIFIIVDDQDKMVDKYRAKFGQDKVIQFCKSDIHKVIDTGDNFDGMGSTIYPRKAFWDIARNLGYRYFMQLDDDYTDFQYFFDSQGKYKYRLARKTLRKMIKTMFEYFKSIPAMTLAMSQGGDFIGGGKVQLCRLRRKAMNIFLCDTEKPWDMYGRRNEDVTAYVLGNLRGQLFLTVLQAKITQVQSQKNPGLITDAYLESGTYIKSFYSVMYAPACVQIGVLSDRGNSRIHHKIKWNNTAVKILDEKYKKLAIT